MLVLLNSINCSGMSEAQPGHKSLYFAKGPEAEITSFDDIFPEKRLWIAIVVIALQDYADQLKHIEKLWKADGKPVPKNLLNMLRTTKYEMRHRWFAAICEHAGVDQSHVIRRIQQLDEEFGLAQIQFAQIDTKVSRIQLRKARKRLQYA